MAMDGQWMANAGREDKYQYNGKELHDDFGLGWYEYGARFYDPAIGRFSSIDRFAEKFVFQSPYTYAANDPIKFIDVNGDSIAIRVDKNNVAFYDNGNLYNRDGTQYTGKGVKVKKDGSIKLKGFLKSTVSALDNIRTGGPAGNNLVSTLQSDSDKFVIDKGANSNLGRSVKFDPSNTQSGLDETGGTNRPAYIGLAHELAHALDWDDGSVDAGTWITYSDGSTSPNAEKYASHIENQIRAENKIPLRAYYGIDGGKGKGRLIIPGTRMSANYSMNVGKFIIPYIYPK